MMTRALAAAVAAFALSAGAAQAATTIVEAPAGFSCGPAGCVEAKDHGFSHVLDLSRLTGPITISGLSFDRSLLGQFGKSMLHITFWTNNGQTLVDDYGNYLAGVLGGETLTLNGHMFVWDASNGDLSFKIEVVDWNNGGLGGAGASAASGVSQALEHISDEGLAHSNSPLFQQPTFVQNLADAAVTAVPEPAGWTLMILGLGGLGALLRARHRPVQA